MAGTINLEGVKRDIGIMVQSLARNVHDYERTENTAPKTLVFMFSEFPENEEGIKYNWQCFTVPDTGEEVQHKSFVDFVLTSPPRGLGTTIGKLEVLVRDEHPELLPYLKDSKIPPLRAHGENQHVGIAPVNNNSLEYGTSNDAYIIARLKRDDPTLAKQVINGEISAHAAAVQSGIRKRYVSVRCDPEGFVSKIYQLFSEEEIEFIKDNL